MENEPKEQVEIEEDVYDTARTEKLGWCVPCGDFTTADVEPQECTEAGCTECAEPGVLGALAALRGGFIKVNRALLAVVLVVAVLQ